MAFAPVPFGGTGTRSRTDIGTFTPGRYRGAVRFSVRARRSHDSVGLAAVEARPFAGAGSLGPGDAQLASGEYYDRVTFQGNAGDVVLIEITSSAFDPYLILLDQSDNVLFQEDD